MPDGLQLKPPGYRVEPNEFTDYYVLSVEGLRVALASCKSCGCAILLDGSERIHLAWEAKQQRIGKET